LVHRNLALERAQVLPHGHDAVNPPLAGDIVKVSDIVGEDVQIPERLALGPSFQGAVFLGVSTVGSTPGNWIAAATSSAAPGERRTEMVRTRGTSSKLQPAG
jgi:hypothetical protein